MAQTQHTLDVDGLSRLTAGKALGTLIELAFELDLFAKLKGRKVPLSELAQVWEMPATSARFIAQCLANFHLLVYSDGTVSNGPLAESQLTEDTLLRRTVSLPFKYDFTVAELKDHLLDPPPLQWYQLRDEGEIYDPRALIRQDPEGWVEALTEQRHELRIARGTALSQSYDFSSHRKLLDVGGSSGGYCVGIRRKYPDLPCMVFDIPEAAGVARKILAETGEDARIEVIPGSVFETDLPRGADVVLIANVLHLFTPEDNRDILKKIYEALPPGGTVLVRESYFEDDWSGSVEAIFDAFVLLGKEGKSGWQPTYEEMEAIVADTGFTELERRVDFIVARRPE